MVMRTEQMPLSGSDFLHWIAKRGITVLDFAYRLLARIGACFDRDEIRAAAESPLVDRGWRKGFGVGFCSVGEMREAVACDGCKP